MCGDIPSVPSLPSTQIQSFPGFPSTGTTIVHPWSPCGPGSPSLFIFHHNGSTPGVEPVVGQVPFRIHVRYSLLLSGYLTIASEVYVVPQFQSHSRCGDNQFIPFVQLVQFSPSCPGVPVLPLSPLSHWSPFCPFSPVAHAGIQRLRVYLFGSIGSCSSVAVGISPGWSFVTVHISRLGVCPSFPCGPCGANCVALLYVNVPNVGLRTSSSLNCPPTTAFVE